MFCMPSCLDEPQRRKKRDRKASKKSTVVEAPANEGIRSAPRVEPMFLHPAATTYYYYGWAPVYYAPPAGAGAAPTAFSRTFIPFPTLVPAAPAGMVAEPAPAPTPRAPIAPISPMAPMPTAQGQVRCDKCDGGHATEECPHFKKPREKHPDAWRFKGKSHLVAAEQPEEPKFVSRASVVRQPMDGSCLYHSVSYGLGDGSTASSLRRHVAETITTFPQMPIKDDIPLREWIRMDKDMGVRAYVQDLLAGAWGGGIELAVLSQTKQVCIEVYEPCLGGYQRISRFGSPGQRTVSILFQGREHYDALVL